MTTYTIYHPDYLGRVIGEITDKGKLLNGSNALDYLIGQVQRGVAKEKTKNIRCVPDIPNVKEKDVVLLSKLVSKPKNRGSNQGLTTISETNRYKGKINWQEKKPSIQKWIKNGLTVSAIAKKLGINQSTLSKANKKHNLYLAKLQIGQILH